MTVELEKKDSPWGEEGGLQGMIAAEGQGSEIDERRCPANKPGLLDSFRDRLRNGEEGCQEVSFLYQILEEILPPWPLTRISTKA